MNANDARLVRLFTAETGSKVPDDTPNASLGAPQTTFDLVLEGEAGNNIGGTGAPYTLTITCFDWSTGNLADASMNPTIPAQTFDGSATTPVLWKRSGTNFLTQQVFRIPAAGALPGTVKGHLFTYTVSLVTQDFNIVSTLQSNLFVVV
jgi:hypothetical protein